MGYLATSKTKIRNTLLILDKSPNYNSGQQGNSFTGELIIQPNFLKYTFDLPSYLNYTDIISFRLYDIKGAVDDRAYLNLNGKDYYVGGGWSLCPDKNNCDCSNVWNSPFIETELNVPMELIKNTNNSLFFYGYSHSGPAWLILNSFKFSVSYITK